MAQSDDNGFGLLLLGVLGLYFFAPSGWTNAVWYGIEYGVGPSKVATDPKPKECDFMHAPLGDKGCSYKPHVRTYNAAGVLVGGEDAPYYGTDSKTGKPVISYDGGKSWDWYPGGNLPERTVDSVKVF